MSIKIGLDVRANESEEQSGFMEDDELDIFGLGSERLDDGDSSSENSSLGSFNPNLNKTSVLNSKRRDS